MRPREKRTYHLLSRRSLFCAKTVQGECSSKEGKRSFTRLDGAEPMPVLCKDSASERNESLLLNCRAQPVLCKDSASERNESLLSDCRAQPVLCKDNTNYSMNKIKAQIKCKKTPPHQLPGSHPPLPLYGHAPTARGTHHPCLTPHTSTPSVPTRILRTENPEAETRCFLDFFFTKQNSETDIRTTQKRTFRTPLTPLRHASTPLPIPQKGFSGSPQSPFHDAERTVSQHERASLAMPKSPSGNAEQRIPHCKKHHKGGKALNINNL